MDQVTWLSGEILTFLSKTVGLLWAAVVAGYSLILLSAGQASFPVTARPPVVIVLLATVFAVWLSMRTERLGYTEHELVISNFLREERIPFDQVEEAEAVWWRYRRLVRVRFRSHTSFGKTIYYIPKWIPLRMFKPGPETELRELLAAKGNFV